MNMPSRIDDESWYALKKNFLVNKIIYWLYIWRLVYRSVGLASMWWLKKYTTAFPPSENSVAITMYKQNYR